MLWTPTLSYYLINQPSIAARTCLRGLHFPYHTIPYHTIAFSVSVTFTRKCHEIWLPYNLVSYVILWDSLVDLKSYTFLQSHWPEDSEKAWGHFSLSMAVFFKIGYRSNQIEIFRKWTKYQNGVKNGTSTVPKSDN